MPHSHNHDDDDDRKHKHGHDEEDKHKHGHDEEDKHKHKHGHDDDEREDKHGGQGGRLEALKIAEDTERRHETTEVLAGVGALAAAGVAAWQGYAATADPENAKTHAAIAAAAGAAALGAGGFAVHEHSEQKKQERLEEELGSEDKKHGWF